MKLKVSEILSFLTQQNLNPSYYGDMNLEIDGFSNLDEAKNSTLVWIKDLSSFEIEKTDLNTDILIISNKEYSGEKKYNIISCLNPKAAFFSVLKEYFSEAIQLDIAETSTILSKKIGANVSIGHNCFIDENVVIGNNSIIRNNVVIEGSVTIGDNCIIESSAVIGSMGFGYYNTDENVPQKVPDFGGVVIGHRVDIGANTCIDRGTLSDTMIGDDSKIDNLCHIAHNAIIGERCTIAASSEISGSVIIDDDVYIAPCASIINQANIGTNVLIGIGSVVINDVDSNLVVAGVPAKVLKDNV